MIGFEGAPDELAILLYSRQADQIGIPGAALILGPPYFSFAIVPLDGAGLGSMATTVALPTGTLSLSLFLQPLFFDGGAPPGERLHLGRPTALELLDASF